MLQRVIFGVARYHVDRATAETAAAFAGRLGLELLGLLIEDDNLKMLPALPFAKELRSLSGEWAPVTASRLALEAELAASISERKLRDIALKANARPTLVSEPAAVNEMIASMPKAGDVVVVPASRNALQTIGRTAESLTQSGLRSVALFAPDCRLREKGPVMILKDSQEAGITHLAELIARAWQVDLIVAEAQEALLPLSHIHEQLVVATTAVLDATMAADIALRRKVPVLLLSR